MHQQRTFIIAEAGSNHNRDLITAINLIGAAAHAGCDAVKFQLFTGTKLYAVNTPGFAGYKDLRSLMSSIELPRPWLHALFVACNDNGVEFMATPFDEDAIDCLVSLGVKKIKIAGFEALDARFVRLVASTGLPIIFSAGIGSSTRSVLKTIELIREEKNLSQITVLHCNHAYPTPLADVNLGTITHLKNLACDRLFNVGYSDHTTGIFVPPVAVGVGATMIEKHFTLNRSLHGPDHKFAIEPDELSLMVENIRRVEMLLSKRTLTITQSELVYEQALRSIVALRDIDADERISNMNITTSRPFIKEAIDARHWDTIVDGNHFAKRKLYAQNVVLLHDIETRK